MSNLLAVLSPIITTKGKVYDKSISNKGGQTTWSTWMWILIMEQLVLLCTPPAAIVHNMLSVIKAITPKMEVKELSTVHKHY